MTGYVRQSAADIVPTAVVRAAPINNELNALRDAFEQTAGHKHDGTAAEGHYVPLIADADAKNKVVVDTVNNRVGVSVEVGGVSTEQVRIQDGAVVPVTDNDVDLGTSSLEFKDLYIDGTANIDSLIADTADINAGTIDNTVVGSTTPAAATVTNLTVNTAATIASADINAGTIDGAVIGSAAAQAITGTLVTATTGFVGGLTGDVVGNTAGTHTGAVVGNVTGNLTGNVTASSGSSSFNDVVINGNLNMNAGTAATITNLSNPVNAGDAATKGYVDAADALKLNLAGGTMSGAIVMGTNKITGLGAPTATTDAVTKEYVDTVDALKLNLSGGTMSGAIAMGGNKVTGVGTPAVTTDAATKGYVDTSIANLIDTAPGALDTLNELAAALGDDPNFATTVTNEIATKVSKAGDTMSGNLAMGGNKVTGLGTPTLSGDAATKTYVDTADALKLNLSGGTMSGAIAMGTNKITGVGDPTANQDVATKTYVDAADALKLNLVGGTMSGAIAMGTNKITGVGDPTANQDVATKVYVDNQDALKLSLTGGSMSGAIAMGGNKVTDLGTPTVDADATTKLYVDGILGSATSAAASAAAAAISASDAATSASNASTSASNAATSESNAASSASDAAASYDSFDDRYLGVKASAPTLDNDGDALLVGALYWNSTSSNLWVWSGSAWVQATLTAGDFLTLAGIQTLTNKTISADNNTLNGIAASSFVLSNASGVIDGAAVQKAIPDGVVVGTTDVQTLTNKTLTSPVINTPTGIVKGDVGLGNVDDTSDATKNAATAILTNKTINGSNNTITNVSLTAGVTGTLPVANGGTGNTTAQAEMNRVAQTVTSGQYLRGDGTNVVMSAIQAADVPTLNQNTTGNAATATALQTARNIGGVSFNGTANIDLPGVNTAGNQNTSGVAANVSGTVVVANGGTGATTNTAARTNLGATTLGSNLFTITNPSAVTFPRFNADNTVSSLDAASFRTAIGAGTSSTTGTVTSVSGTGTASGLSLSGTVTTSGNITLSGTVNSLAAGTYAISISGNAATAGGFTPSQTAGAANRIVVADANGYISNNYFNSTDNSQASGVTAVMVKAGDSYLRSGTSAAIATFISGQTMNINGSSTSCSGNATTATNATNVTVTTSTTSSAFKVPFANTTASTTGNYGLLQDSTATFTYNPSTNTLAVGTVSGALSGNATTATTLQTARTINGVSFNGSANITITAAATNVNTQLASLGVGTAASGTAGEIRATNNVTAFFSSDIKFKENVQNIPNAAATAAAIGGKLFDWTDSYIADHGGADGYFVQKHDFGIIAQDALKHFPIAVRTRPDGSLAVDYEKLSALALAAIAEQEVRIAKLEALVAKLIEG